MLYRGDNFDVYVQALLPFPETTPDTRRMFQTIYSALVGPYNVNVEVREQPSQFMPLTTMRFVSLEMPSQHTQPLETFNHPARCVYVTGNSQYLAPAHVMAPPENISRVHVEMPPQFLRADPENTLYGFQILPIVLDHRRRQHAKV